jgi:uncharacterized protein (TIGR00255 family)
MIKSMTGYGKATVATANRTISIEIRSLNSKQSDINTRIASVFREKEADLRSEINRVLERGKIDCSISVDFINGSGDLAINKALMIRYYNEIKQLANELGTETGNNLLTGIMQLPDVLKNAKENLDESEWSLVYAGFVETLARVDEFRTNEGALIEKDMLHRINMIINLLQQIEPLEKSRIVNLRERFQRNQDEFLEKNTMLDKFDENRFEQEIFWYLEKLDITEEKHRLAKHCDYFINTIATAESNGRKLGFITQEIGREINTLGSKAYDAGMQVLVVQMKDELEKIKEQVGNVL